MLCMSASYIQSTHVLCPRVSSTLPFWFLVFISASDRLKKNRKKKSNEWTLNGNFVISYERFWVEIDAKPPRGREKERKRWLQWNIIPRNSHRYFIIGARIAFRNALPAAAAATAAVKRPSTMRHEPQRAAATAEDYISDIDLIPMVLTVNLYVSFFFFFAFAWDKLRTVHSEHVCLCVSAFVWKTWNAFNFSFLFLFIFNYNTERMHMFLSFCIFKSCAVPTRKSY